MSASADFPCVRSVILTGASRGLGAALFQTLQADGARVLGLARTFPADQQALAAQRPASIRLLATDLGDTGTGDVSPDGLGLAGGGLPAAADLTAFVNEPGEPGPADEIVLLLNAATIEPIALAGSLPPEAVLAAVNLNLVAPILLTNLFLAAFRNSEARLRIVYVASSAAHRAYPGWATYCATKAGAEAFMRCVSEAAIRPCEVELVDPGAMETQMQQALRDRGNGLPGHARLVERHRVGDIGDPLTVAKGIIDRHFPPLVAVA
ncbi:SDR family NAD(P)-dependent oxidoreductase [Dactylosporangium sucinum]|uniref:Short-chain dehydrogenase n=1 Tax=Dactylosporangium sucinum TaxID=1424081 RepID=A0A917T2I8_9ACTN|nr:SDR family NAD(P)-dependent oxidoreductase [Dactylosporangium sucinum]GGM07650.1 short-chain dehydrogenase [Dactylosporangium sucinum]